MAVEKTQFRDGDNMEPNHKKDFSKHIHVAADVTLALLMFGLTAHIKNVVDERLEKFISRAEFSAYQLAHREWGSEITRRLEDQIAELKTLATENRKDIQELLKKK